MTTEELKDEIDNAIANNISSGYEGSIDGRTDAGKACQDVCEEYAKQEAFLFFEFKSDYRRIEGMNVKHYCDEKFNGGLISWVGASNEVIWEAYKKGEQLKRYYEK